MPKHMIVTLGLLAGLACAGPAFASSSQWYEAEGGRIRLVTTGGRTDEGALQGALQIDLKPGWKTYWLDPGDAGVPPTIDVSASGNVPSASMFFPAPHRFDDGFAKWAGYDEPVTFPIVFSLSPDQTPMIEANVFLGICETICVPVQATLSLDPASDPGNADDAAIVKAAFDALPGQARPDFGVTPFPGGKDEVVVEAAFAGDPASVDFFLAGSEDYQFGPPERLEKDGRLFFSLPILQRPDKVPDHGALLYTLVTADGAVSGELPYPSQP